MKDIDCPYCGFEMDINHDDRFEEDRAHELECPECDKSFVFFTSISYRYEAQKADCLNGAPHDLSVYESSTLIRRSCKDCGYAKNEWKK